jgi:hypothetical protein
VKLIRRFARRFWGSPVIPQTAGLNRKSILLSNLRNRKQQLENPALYLSTFVALTLFGGSLFAMMLYASATDAASILTLIRSPFKGGFTFFVIFNSSLELFLLPATLILNWRNPTRRKPLLCGAILYYCARAWTYIYFVPMIFKLMAVPTSALVPQELASEVMKWVNLSWIRCAIDGNLAALLLFATSRK